MQPSLLQKQEVPRTACRLVLQFDDVAGLETKLFSKLARNFDLAVLRQNCVHARKVRAGES
jgi:hypothetical protein